MERNVQEDEDEEPLNCLKQELVVYVEYLRYIDGILLFFLFCVGCRNF